MTPTNPRSREILDRLAELRAADAPTHGGRVLSYVYDPAMPALDELAGAAIAAMQPVNGLDPTAFSSVAALERDVVAFGRRILHGPDAVGSVTSGGTESCVLALKSARDFAGAAAGAGSVVLPTTAHAAFLKGAALLGLRPIRVPVDPVTTAVRPADIAEAIADDTVAVVASAPNYPTGVIDPIPEIAALTSARGVALHVDACLGGLVLPWWPDELPSWDFRVPGVSSISADLHKYGYAPKGASLLLYADRDRHRAQYFALTDWPGYPVVNPTLLGSRSAGPLAAAWAILEYLGEDGFDGPVSVIAGMTQRLREAVAAIDGLRVIGRPTGPVFTVAADPEAADPVDPHRWAAAVGERGFTLQLQPEFHQPDGTVLPASTHFTVTPATAGVLEELIAACRAAADEVRGLPPADPPALLAEVGAQAGADPAALEALLGLSSEDTETALRAAGIDPAGPPADASASLDMPAVIAAVQALPRPLSATLLAEFLAAFTGP